MDVYSDVRNLVAYGDGTILAVMANWLFSISALAALLPAGWAGLTPRARPDGAFWGTLALALVGPALWVGMQLSDSWRTGLSTALWLIIVASLSLFIALALANRHAWRLTPLLIGYLVVLGVLAVIWQRAPERPLLGTAPAAWVQVHILVSVVAYGLLTLGAVAGLGVFLQERALKAKRPSRLTRLLPSVADGEKLCLDLLVASEIVLAVGVLSGMGTNYYEVGSFLRIDHKTVLSVATFAVIGVLIVAHYRHGVRGRQASRMVLFAYLLLTLAYPGVKFVTDVLMGS